MVRRSANDRPISYEYLLGEPEPTNREIIDCLNIWKRSEAANLVFQLIFVLNWEKHSFSQSLLKLQTSHRRVTDESQTSTDESQMTTDESQTSYRRLHTSHRRVTEDYRWVTDKSQTSHRQLKTNLRRMQLNHRLLQATGITKCIFSRWHSLINLFADLLILVTMKNDLYMKL